MTCIYNQSILLASSKQTSTDMYW